MKKSFEASERLMSLIEKYANDSVSPIRESDPETAEFNYELMHDYMSYWCNVLSFVNKKYCPEKVLYPGVGFDFFPKEIFGDQETVMTSIENFSGTNDQYFNELKGRNRIIADNKKLPFCDQIFSGIVISGIGKDAFDLWSKEMMRVLKPEGFILVGKSILVQDLSKHAITRTFNRNGMNKKILPKRLQGEGISEACFSLYQK